MTTSGRRLGVKAVVAAAPKRTRGEKILAGLGDKRGSPARIFLLVKRGCGQSGDE
jgi:hypothetical protein